MSAALDKRIDWPEMYGEWIKAKMAGETLTAFAERVHHGKAYLSTRFKEIQIELIKDQMANIVTKGVDIVSKSLNSDNVNPEFALKATTSMADRIGMSPQSQQINVNQSNTVNISLFSVEDKNEINNMLGVKDEG